MDVRPSFLAGSWYSGEAVALEHELDGYLGEECMPWWCEQVLGLVVPHAGHCYSGRVAGAAFKVLRGLEVDMVAIVGPYHSMHSAIVLGTAHEAYETPLGRVRIAQEAVSELNSRLGAWLGSGLGVVCRDREHSLEVELPFLQRVLSRFTLVPVMLVEQSVEVAEVLGEALAEVLAGRKAVLVASSDLSHFYPQSIAEKLDWEILRRIEAFDAAGVIEAESEGVGYACGCGAIAAVLEAARRLGADRAEVVRYATSGDVTGERESVVGYGSVVIGRSRKG